MVTRFQKKPTVVQTAKNEPVTTVNIEYYQLIVGFEVNKPNAFVNNTQILDIDYGHAFFYLTKNGIVKKFFSFGPMGGGKKGKAHAHRKGNPSYDIGEQTRLFRFSLSSGEFDTISKETDKITADIISEKQKYTAMVNDTCAETAYDIIVKGYSSIPNGTGPVDAVGWAPNISAVNPYMWHHNLKKAGVKEHFINEEKPKGWAAIMAKYKEKPIKDPIPSSGSMGRFPNDAGDY
jgi:hypothetical protein